MLACYSQRTALQQEPIALRGGCGRWTRFRARLAQRVYLDAAAGDPVAGLSPRRDPAQARDLRGAGRVAAARWPSGGAARRPRGWSMWSRRPGPSSRASRWTRSAKAPSCARRSSWPRSRRVARADHRGPAGAAAPQPAGAGGAGGGRRFRRLLRDGRRDARADPVASPAFASWRRWRKPPGSM